MRTRKAQLGRSARNVKDFSVLDFNYAPEQPLMRDECGRPVDAMVRFDVSGIRQTTYRREDESMTFSLVPFRLFPWLRKCRLQRSSAWEEKNTPPAMNFSAGSVSCDWVIGTCCTEVRCSVTGQDE